MASGVKLSESIDGGLEDLTGQEAALAGHLRSAVATLGELRGEQAKAYRGLAALRLDDIESGALAQSLDAAERRAIEGLKASAKARKMLETKIRQGRKNLASFLQRIDKQGDVIETAGQELDEAEAKLQSALARDKAYRDQAAATEEAVRVADEANRKTELAEGDRVEKGKPYEADPFFMYLWSRGFGTSEYRHWGIIKTLDQWVARLCGYQTARLNYSMLLEIPERLRAHTQRVGKTADTAIDALAAMEQSARDEAGVSALEKNLEIHRTSLSKLGESRQTATDGLAVLERELARFDRGEDENTVAALDELAQELQQDTLRRLQHEAMLTPDLRDDTLVEQIASLDFRIQEAEEDVAVRQESLRVLAQRRAELEEVRTEFRDKRYHTSDFEFDDHGALEALLGGLLRGAVTGSHYWSEVQRSSRRRRKPRSNTDFGSRSYRPSSTSWTRSSSTRSPGSFRTGGTMSRSSGFKTGGGF